MTDTSFGELVEEYLEETWRLDPVEASSLGVHRFDPLLPDASKEGIEERDRRLGELLGGFEATEVNGLSGTQRLEHKVGLINLKRAVREAEALRPWERYPHLYPTMINEGIFPLVVRDYAPLEVRLEGLLGRVQGIPTLLAEAQVNLTQQVSPVFCQLARRSAQGAMSFLDTAVEELGAAVPAAQAELSSAAAAASEALDQFVAFLSGLESQAEGEFAVGREHFDFLLQEYHLLEEDADDMLALGEEETARIERELGETARQIDPERSWPELIEEIKLDHPSVEELIDAYRHEVELARQQVLDHELVSIPSGERCDVEWGPAFQRPIIALGNLSNAAPFEEGDRTIWTITTIPPDWPADRQESQLRDHNRVYLRSIAMHETYPGHHLQRTITNRLDSHLLRCNKSTLFWEGWGLYTEQLYWEIGFLAEPRLRLWQLKNELWRSVRIIIDTGLHTRGMTVDEGVDLLVDRVKLERPSAEAEVSRYTTSPTQPLTYLVGKHKMLDLREAYRTQKGDEFTLGEFHDRLLSYGCIPPQLVREEMLSSPGGS